MNKLLTKIVGAALGLTMTVGVGVAIASNQKVEQVKATGETWASSNDTFELATSIASGDEIIIVSTYAANAMGSQGDNNRGVGGVTKAGNSVSNKTAKPKAANSVALITVGTHKVSGTDYFTFGVDGGYLYDASTSSKNYLRTQNSVTDNGYADWTVSINASGIASITARSASASSKLTMSYNAGSSIFACYASLQTNGGLEIYKKAASTAEVDTVTASIKSGTYYTGSTLSASDFDLTVTWTEGKADTHPTEGFTWTVNGVANGTLSEGNNSVVVTYEGVSSAAFNVVGTTVHATAVSITETTASVRVGNTVTLHGSVTPANAVDNISWSSNKTNIATVNSSGVVTGVAEGSATITATANGHTDTCTVNVMSTPDVEIGGTTLRNATSYTDSSTDVTVNGIPFAYTQLMATAANTGIMQIAKNHNGFWNTSELGLYIKAVEVSVDTNEVNVYFGTEEMTSASGTAYNVSSSDGSKVVTPASNTFQYLRIETGGSYAKVNYVNIWYAPFVPTVELEESSFEFTETTEGYIENDVTASHFSGAVSYSFESSDEDVLDADDIIEIGGTVTIAKSDIAPGETTVTVTATYSTESASADFTITCNAAARNLLSIAITTSSNDTEFEAGGKFTIGGLVVTGTFDKAPLTADVTSECTFKLWNGSAESALTPGTTTIASAGNYTVRVSHASSAAAETLTYGISVFASMSFSIDGDAANGYGTEVKTTSKDITLNSTQSLTSTVDIDTVNFYKNSGMQMNPGKNSDPIYIKNTTAVPGRILRIEMTWSGTSNNTPTIYFSNSYFATAPTSGGTQVSSGTTTHSVAATGTNQYFYFDGRTTGGTCVLTEFKVVYIENEVGQAKNFADKYLLMNTYDQGGSHGSTNGNNTCLTQYDVASTAYGKLTAGQKTEFAKLSAAVTRMEDWATANGYTFNAAAGTFTQNSKTVITDLTKNSNVAALIAIISVISLSAVAGYFFLRKRKEQ